MFGKNRLQLVVSNAAEVPPSRASFLPSFRVSQGLRTAFRSALCRAGRAGLAVLWGSLLGARYLLLWVMMWIRVAVSIICMGCVIFGMIGLALAALLRPDFSIMWKIALFSFGAFCVLMIYDILLTLVNPEKE